VSAIRVRIVFGNRRRLLKYGGKVGIERQPSGEEGIELVRVIDVGPWLAHYTREDIFIVKAEIKNAAEGLTEEEWEFLEEHAREVAKKMVEAACKDVDRAWATYALDRGIVSVLYAGIEDFNFAIQLRLEPETERPERYEEDLVNFSRVVQGLEKRGAELLAEVLEELMR